MIADFKKKQKSNNPKKYFLLITATIFFAIVLSILTFANIKIYRKKQELRIQIENLKQKIEDIKNENNLLGEKIEKSSDVDYVEKVAREELGLQKENENTTVFLIPKQENEKNENQESKQNLFIKIWQNIINTFK